VLEYQRLVKLRAITRQAELVKKKNAPAAKKSFKKKQIFPCIVSLLGYTFPRYDTKTSSRICRQLFRPFQNALPKLQHACNGVQNWGKIGKSKKLNLLAMLCDARQL
jgi:hypothetical protein